MVTWVGPSDSDYVISDNATPASGTYAWGLKGCNPKFSKGFKAFQELELPEYKVKIAGPYPDWIWVLNTTLAKEATTPNSSWEKLMKMIHKWEEDDSLLYLKVLNTWGINLAQYGTFGTPTTLTQIRGRILGFAGGEVKANSIEIKQIVFGQYTE